MTDLLRKMVQHSACRFMFTCNSFYIHCLGPAKPTEVTMQCLADVPFVHSIGGNDA